ncbi:hypothetical protein [Streptomyces noursei]|nr:hypothetical protein [Streptomyces noursei]
MAQLDAETVQLQQRRAALEVYAQVMRERGAQDEALAARALRSG